MNEKFWLNYIKANSIHPDCSKLTFNEIKDVLRQEDVVFKPLKVVLKKDIVIDHILDDTTIVLKKEHQ